MTKSCEKCGVTHKADGKFCGECGTIFETKTKKEAPLQGAASLLLWLAKGAWLLAAGAFFLPFVTAQAILLGGVEVAPSTAFSGWQLATGENVLALPWVLLLLLLPAVAVLLLLFSHVIKPAQKRVIGFVLLLNLAGLLGLGYFWATVQASFAGFAAPTWVFYVFAALYAAAFLFTLSGKLLRKK